MKSNRRKFLKNILFALTLPFLYIWRELTLGTMKSHKAGRIKIPLKSISEGAQEFAEVILNKQGKQINVLSTRCTHLGCRVNLNDKIIVCPCHGSEYDLSGKVIKGPAVKNLKQLKFVEKEKELIIQEQV